MTVTQDTQILTKRLDAIINVLLETARPDGKQLSVMDRVRILNDAGLRPIDIARILGITLTHVNVNLHTLRKSKKIHKGKK